MPQTDTTTTRRRGARTRRVLVVAVAAVLAAPATTFAALPAKKSAFEAHDHVTEGKNWHVQVEIGKDPRKAKTLVVYSEQCGVTGFKENVPIAEDGRLLVTGTAKGGATWAVDARFPLTDQFAGTMRIVKGDCDTGGLPFDVREGREGDGHTDHTHSDPAYGQTHNHGPKFPTLEAASAAELKQAENLRLRVRRAAETRFRTYRASRALDFKRFARKWKRPVIFHLRHRVYTADDRIFDPKRPESLVYWWPRRGDPILLGFMFRAPAGERPAFAGPIPIFHRHPNAQGQLGDNQMTHVWLTGGLKSAWSNCLPIKQLELQNPNFRYEPPRSGVSGPESTPC